MDGILPLGQMEVLEQVLNAKDEDSIHLGLQIIDQLDQWSTKYSEDAMRILFALRDVVLKDNTPDRSDISNVRHKAVALVFKIGKMCNVDPIELFFTVRLPGPLFEAIDETLDI